MTHKMRELKGRMKNLLYAEYPSEKDAKFIAKTLAGKVHDSEFIVEPHSYHGHSWIILRLNKNGS
jgi:hypothetical protein